MYVEATGSWCTRSTNNPRKLPQVLQADSPFRTSSVEDHTDSDAKVTWDEGCSLGKVICRETTVLVAEIYQEGPNHFGEANLQDDLREHAEDGDILVGWAALPLFLNIQEDVMQGHSPEGDEEDDDDKHDDDDKVCEKNLEVLLLCFTS